MLLAAADDATRQHCVRVFKAALAPREHFVYESKMQIAPAAALKADLFHMKNLAVVTALFDVLGNALNHTSPNAAGFTQIHFFREFDALQMKAAGFDAAFLKVAGFTAEEVMQTFELDLGALGKLGYGAAELNRTGFSPEDLVKAPGRLQL